MNRIAFLWIFLSLLTAHGLFSQNPHQKINFDRDWKFHFGHAADPAKDFNFSVATIFSKTGKTDKTALEVQFDDSAWRRLNVPHDWAVELPFVNVDNFDVMAHGYKPVGGLFPETSIGWYRKAFTIPAADSTRRFVIQFDGIFRDAQVWVNGFYLGRNESGYIGMAYDLTDYLRYDQPNALVVRVDATQYEGWFYEGAGIYRHVWLHRLDPLHVDIDGVFVHTRGIGPTSLVSVQADVVNDLNQQNSGSAYMYIADRNGKKLSQSPETPFTLDAQGKTTLKQELILRSPRLWSLEDPYLYRLVTVVRKGKTVADTLETRFGVRQIEISASQGLLLNGKPVKVQGVNCHQDHAGVGSALPDDLQYYRIRLLKELGVNAYRASHNPPTPELLDACDSLGMLVMDETRLLNSSPEYVSQFERLVRRDRNHPSIFMWSIGNEEGWVQTNNTGKRIAQTMLAFLQKLDPTRTATYAADLANVFSGINEVIPVRGFNYRHQGVVDYHRDHPSQPIVGTEMGSTVTTRGIYEKDTVRAYVPDQDITAPWWASTAEAWWPLCAENPWFMGGFVWTGLDYRGEPTPYQWPNINSHFGIMDMCGFPKNIYYYYQSWWKKEDVLHISPHWNWQGKEGQPIDVWVNSNAGEVELFLNGKSLGKKAMPRNKHLQWEVPYQPGVLEATGYYAGREVRTKVETTGPAYQMVLVPDRTTLRADGAAAVVVNVHVVDAQGREVPTANDLIRFSIKGPGRIIGVGNGDPSSHEPDKCPEGAWQRRLFNGKCQLILQSADSAGEVVLEAVGEGLKPAQVTVKAN